MEALDRQRLIHRVSNPSSTARVPIRPVPLVRQTLIQPETNIQTRPPETSYHEW